VATLALYATKPIVNGNKEFKDAQAWARKNFKIGSMVSGRTFEPIKKGALAELYFSGKSEADNHNVLAEVVCSGYRRLEDSRIPSIIRMDPSFQVWRKPFADCQLHAKSAKKGLWQHYWK
jgi:hypothetical protein